MYKKTIPKPTQKVNTNQQSKQPSKQQAVQKQSVQSQRQNSQSQKQRMVQQKSEEDKQQQQQQQQEDRNQKNNELLLKSANNRSQQEKQQFMKQINNQNQKLKQQEEEIEGLKSLLEQKIENSKHNVSEYRYLMMQNKIMNQQILISKKNKQIKQQQMIIQDIDHVVQSYLSTLQDKENSVINSISRKIEDINQKYNYLMQNDDIVFNSDYKNSQQSRQSNRLKIENQLQNINKVLSMMIEHSDIELAKQVYSSNNEIIMELVKDNYQVQEQQMEDKLVMRFKKGIGQMMQQFTKQQIVDKTFQDNQYSSEEFQQILDRSIQKSKQSYSELESTHLLFDELLRKSKDKNYRLNIQRCEKQIKQIIEYYIHLDLFNKVSCLEMKQKHRLIKEQCLLIYQAFVNEYKELIETINMAIEQNTQLNPYNLCDQVQGLQKVQNELKNVKNI